MRAADALASKSLIERLDVDDAAALGIDPNRLSYTTLADISTATDKARRDAPAIAVCELQDHRTSDTAVRTWVASDQGAGVIDHIAFLATEPEHMSARLERFGIEGTKRHLPEHGRCQLFVAHDRTELLRRRRRADLVAGSDALQLRTERSGRAQ